MLLLSSSSSFFASPSASSTSSVRRGMMNERSERVGSSSRSGMMLRKDMVDGMESVV